MNVINRMGKATAIHLEFMLSWIRVGSFDWSLNLESQQKTNDTEQTSDSEAMMLVYRFCELGEGKKKKLDCKQILVKGQPVHTQWIYIKNLIKKRFFFTSRQVAKGDRQ